MLSPEGSVARNLRLRLHHERCVWPCDRPYGNRVFLAKGDEGSKKLQKRLHMYHKGKISTKLSSTRSSASTSNNNISKSHSHNSKVTTRGVAEFVDVNGRQSWDSGPIKILEAPTPNHSSSLFSLVAIGCSLKRGTSFLTKRSSCFVCGPS